MSETKSHLADYLPTREHFGWTSTVPAKGHCHGCADWQMQHGNLQRKLAFGDCVSEDERMADITCMSGLSHCLETREDFGCVCWRPIE